MSNCCNAVRDYYACKSGAVVKRKISYYCNLFPVNFSWDIHNRLVSYVLCNFNTAKLAVVFVLKVA